MKKVNDISFLIVVCLLFSMVSCSSSGNATRKNSSKAKIDHQENWTLKDHLIRKTGVRVLGERIVIRGESSTIDPGGQPLFIIDGQRAGRSLATANEMISRGDIKSVEVLPPSKASLYGMEGYYGVIEIHTINSN